MASKKPKGKNKDKDKIGRPTKYQKKYCNQIVKFFDRELHKVIKLVDKSKDSKGKVTTRTIEKAVVNAFPTLERFAFEIGVDADTLGNWAAKHPDFFGAIAKAKNLQKNLLIEGGLSGVYNSKFAVFVATNVTDMVDKKEVDTRDLTMQQILDDAEEDDDDEQE